MSPYLPKFLCFSCVLLSQTTASKDGALSDGIEPGPIAVTSLGSLRGRWLFTQTTQHRVNAFLGVPYAEPPIDDLRFAKPKLWTNSWDGERDASQYGALCPQDLAYLNSVLGQSFSPPNITSEDCLFLDIYSTSNTESAPVLVFIHGGGYVIGSGSNYDGSALAAFENLVVVSISYRLGAFGYFHRHGPGDRSSMGHLGHHDQQVALQWVQKHIMSFGGDPMQVTLGGHSAGAHSVGYHLLAESSQGLFHRAILHSGYLLAHSKSASQDITLLKDFAESIGCLQNEDEVFDKYSILSCIHSHSTKDITDTAISLTMATKDPGLWRPLFDDINIARDVQAQIHAGNFTKVPILIGVTANEGYGLAQFVFPEMFTTSDEKLTYQYDIIPMLKRYLEQLLGRSVVNMDGILAEVLDFYFGVSPLMLDDEIYLKRRLTEVLGDSWHMAPLVRLAQLLSADASKDVYLYDFAHRAIHEADSRPVWHKGCDHGSELQFFLGVPFLSSHVRGQASYTDKEEQFSRTVMAYYAAFIRKGDPNMDDLMRWHPFTSSEDYMILQPSLMTASTVKKSRVTFWTSKLQHLKRKKPHQAFHEEL